MTRSIAYGSARRGATLAALAFCTLAGAASAAAADRPPTVAPTIELVVRVYDNSGAEPRDVYESNQVAGRLLRQAGIAVRWIHCGVLATREEGQPCRRPRRPGEVVLRLAMSTEAISPVPGSLGFTLLDRAGHPTVVATVFSDRVQRVAAHVQIDPTVLAGRAMAHELGHVLLGTSGHASTGLMRAVWSDTALRSDADRDWELQPDEIDAIRRRTAVASWAFDAVGGN